MISVKRTFKHDARSLRGAVTATTSSPPVGLRQLTASYLQDLVFDEPIVTGSGVALGGRHTLTLSADGRYRYEGHLRATGLPSYEAAVAAVVTYPVVTPDGSPAWGSLAFGAQGKVHGSLDPGDNVYPWSHTGTSAMVASQWGQIRRGRLSHHLDYDTNWFGPAGDVVSFLGQVAVLNLAFGPVGAGLVVAGEVADQLQVSQAMLPGVVGVLVAAGASYALGPGYLVPAFVAGAVATAALVKQRPLDPVERAFADKVFAGRIPYDRIRVSNLTGLGDRPFTIPGPGEVILVNLGDGYDSPTTYRGHGRGARHDQAPGQMFVHELTHAWQIANNSFTPEYFCDSWATAVGTSGGDMSAYHYRDEDYRREWSYFNPEQQASIVDDWFGGDGSSNTQGKQHHYPPMDEDEPTAPPAPDGHNPFYRFIRDNIRSGVAD